MIPRDVLAECEKIAQAHSAVRRLLDAYNILAESPYLDSYMVVYGLIDGWQSELKENATKVRLLNAEDKAFDRAFKLSTSMSDLIAGLDAIRDKMSPEQKEDADKKRKAKKSEGKIVI
jgi:hypothetical protein